MINSNMFLITALLSPILVTIFTVIFSSYKNFRDSLGIIGGIVSFICSLVVAQKVINNETQEMIIVNISNNLDIFFKVTPLGAIFSLLCSGLWILAAMYSVGYMRGNNESNQTRFYSFYSISIFGALAISWSGNLLTLFIFYEFLTFSTYALVAHKQDEKSFRSGKLYLGILVGTSVMLFLPAIIWVWIIAGTTDFTAGGILKDKISYSQSVILLMLFSFGIGKAALMPFHWWLPAAMVAPTPVSALLHAVAVVKAGVFSVLMIICYIFGYEFIYESGSGYLLVWTSVITLFLASVIAMYQDDLKARLAYSTVSQLSYIVLGGAIATHYSVIGSISNIMMHGVGKITLFFCAGAIYVCAKITKISDLNGIGITMPFTFVAFAFGALSIIGIPPFGGSWSKFYLLLGAAQSELTIIILILAVSTILNTFYLLEPVFRAFFLDKKQYLVIRSYPLTIFPEIISYLLIIILFFYVEPLLKLINMIVGKT